MMRLKRICTLIAVLAVISSCSGKSRQGDEVELLRAKSNREPSSKKVILVVADSLMYQAIDEGIKRKLLPTFRYMIDNGRYYKDLVSSFPTMSVTIDSSIVTGAYPDGHHIPGLVWYSADEHRLVNYGTGPMEIMRHGVNPVLTDAIIHLNGKHLNPRIATIYDELTSFGFKSGSINGLIYRGKTDHILAVPPYLHKPTSLPAEIKVKGPDLLALGAFTNPIGADKGLPEGIASKMGFNNEYGVEAVKQLVKARRLPDFLYVYLPDLDQRLHKEGPSDLKEVIKLDGQLNEMLESFGSKKQALEQAIIILIGDSGMSAIVPSGQEPVIDMPDLLKDYNILRPGSSVSKETEIVLAVNETMAYVYKLTTKTSLRNFAELLKVESRIDLIAWEEKGWVHVIRSGSSGELRFKAIGETTDVYKQSWALDGDWKILYMRRGAKKELEYGLYPDALRRLSAALHSHEGEFLIVTAKPGYELAGHSSPAHKGGGGHGSLHRTESTVPMIILGTRVEPEYHRIVDIKKYVLKLLRR